MSVGSRYILNKYAQTVWVWVGLNFYRWWLMPAPVRPLADLIIGVWFNLQVLFLIVLQQKPHLPVYLLKLERNSSEKRFIKHHLRSICLYSINFLYFFDNIFLAIDNLKCLWQFSRCTLSCHFSRICQVTV